MKILISSRSFGKIDSGAVDLLRNNGLEPIFNPYGRKLKENEILDLMNEVIGIIAGTEKITEKIISDNPKLKVISRYGIGLDNINLKTAKEKNIIIYNTPNSPTNAVAELTLALILNLLRKITIVDKNIKEKTWKPDIGFQLMKKTVGIIGLGKIGKKLVELLIPFDVKILACDVNPDKELGNEYDINFVELNELLKYSDIVTLHIPTTEQTKNIIGEKQLSIMKKTAILINTARGGLIDENALYNYLINDKIAGAAIDAFNEEPYTGKLKELENVVLTPHIGSYTVETRKKMEIEAVENLIKGLKEVEVL